MATNTNIKRRALSVSEKLGIIKKVDAQPHVMRTKVIKQLSIPMSILNNIMSSKKNIPQQCVTTHPGRKRLKISKYEKTDSVLLGWFRQKQALNIPIQDPMLYKKAEEIQGVIKKYPDWFCY
jgi:hypothetical protein